MKLKTREALRNVKTLDRGAEGFANKTRDGVSSVNRSVEQTQNVGYETENEYATHEFETREEAIMKGTVSGAERFGRWGVRNTWRNIQKWRNRPRKEKVDINPKQLNPPKRPMLTEGTKKGAKTATKGGKKTAKSTKNTGKAIKGTKRTVKTATRATKQTARATARAAKATARAVKATVKGAVKLAQLIKKAIMAAIKAIKVAIKAIIAAAKAIIASAKAIIAAIAAGGWIAVVVILVIVLVSLLAGSIYGVFVPAEEDGINVYDVMYELDQEYAQKEADLISNCKYDTINYVGTKAKWDEIVAIYAVKNSLYGDNLQSVVTFDQSKSDMLREIYRTVNTVKVETEQETKEVKKEVTDENGNVKEVMETVTLIHLTVVRESLTYLEAAEKYQFNDEQIETLEELLENDNAELWQGLLTPKY